MLYKIGDRVSLIRSKHGWHDGRIVGTITEIGGFCEYTVTDDDGYVYEINHRRDIKPV